jgi:regulator of sirC expression with transglutaminase-like and TPR domain
MAAIKTIDPEAYIDSLAQCADQDIDLALSALAIAALDHPGLVLERFINHLKTLSFDVAERHAQLLAGGASDDVRTQLAALKHVLSDSHAYIGDSETYDDLQNASLIRVIERGKGLPITLAILYIHAARGQGWDICGLNIPGHFLCRIEKDGQRLIFDPFSACTILGAPQLRMLVKKHLGPQAELSAQYYEPASARAILIRLQNNIKYRLIEMEAYADALKVVEVMRRIDPAEYRLLLDAGVLYAKTESPKAAISVLSQYIERAPDARDRSEAQALIRQLSDTLN